MTVEQMREAFDAIVINIGNVKPNSSTPFRFEYRGEKPLWGVQASCGCTSVEVTDDAVIGVYNAGVSGDVNKTITAYFDDGQDMYIRNDKKVVSLNPKKAKITLTIIGNIIK